MSAVELSGRIADPADPFIYLNVSGGANSRHHSLDDAMEFARLQEYSVFRIYDGSGVELFAQVKVDVYATRTAGGPLQPTSYRAASF